MSKGSKQRPTDKVKYASEWDRLYGNKNLTDEELLEKMQWEAKYGFRDSEEYYDEDGNFVNPE